MWDSINQWLLIAEAVMIIVWCRYVFGKKKTERTLSFAGAVFLLNVFIYFIPCLHGNTGENGILGFLGSISGAIKQFVGEFETEQISGYAKEFCIYNFVFALGAGLAVASTGSAAIDIFGRKIKNNIGVNRILKGKSCDIVVGNSSAALSYARRNENTILLISDTVEKDYVETLIEDGYKVLRKNLSVEFFNGKYFNNKTQYNIIYPNDSNNFSDDISVIISYLDSDYEKKNFHFYVELDENATEIVQDQIDKKEKAEENKPENERRKFREYITVFSRNELMARSFVEKNPITKYMPKEFLKADSSVKPGVKINVFMVGFGNLSKEIYKQFVMNNQLATLKDGEYRVFPLNYYIYAPDADAREWYVDGLKNALTELEKTADKYFTMPDMPYNTVCKTKHFRGRECEMEICKTVEEKDSLSYIIIDTGDVYRNIDIRNKLELFLNKSKNFHIFIYNESLAVNTDEDTSCYGDLDEVFTHDVIINESLIDMAKEINKVYFKKHNYPDGNCTEKELENGNKEDWKKAQYFTAYSNIYLANNIRLKLNLLGLDYKMDGEGKDIALINEKYGKYSKG